MRSLRFYVYRRIAAYRQQYDGTKVSEYMTLKLMRKLGIKSRMQKRYRKPKIVVTVDQKTNLLTPESVKELINRIKKSIVSIRKVIIVAHNEHS